jgi:hypothetical protein
LDDNKLFLGIASNGKWEYQFVYREAANVYWDPERKGFTSTEIKEWTPSQWYSHIIDVVRRGLGVELRLGDSVQWTKISNNEETAILLGGKSE